MPQTEKAGISQGVENPTPYGRQGGVGASTDDGSMVGQSRRDVGRSGKAGEAISTERHSSRPEKCKHWDSSVNRSLSCLIFFLFTLLPVCHCFWKIAAGQSWCTLDTGENVLTDRYGIKHKVYISRTRDGSVWLRFSADPKSSIEWTFVDEAHVPNQLYILEPSVIEILEKIEYSNSWCVLTDLDLVIRATSGWHPSYLTIFDPQDRQSKTIVYRHNKDCNMSTNISLSTNKQGLTCEGNLKKNACGQRGLPTRGMQTSTIFLRSVNFDPEGLDHWQCSPSNELHTSYTLKGTYYNAFVKMSNCDAPFESRFLGQEAISRPLRDDDEFKDMVLIPDPLHGSLSPGYLSAWRYYVNVHSILHSVAFQVWRPFPSVAPRVHEGRVNQSILPQEQRSASHAASPLLAPRTSVVSPSAPVLRSKYTLVYQQMFHPPDLHYSEFKLEKKNYIQVERGDVLGIYFPDGNPIAWSSVPCALYEQLPKYVRTPPSNMKVGQTFSFQTLYQVSPPNTAPVCRQYSFNAVFVNKSDAYVIEDWICPTRETSTWWSNSWLGSDRPTSSLPVSSLSHFSYDEQKIRQRTSQENVFFHYRNAFKNRSTVFDLTLVRILVATVLGLLLMMSIIGLLSFCKAVKYPQSA